MGSTSGFGQRAFQKEISSLGVFFYRGDSEGEGGSGFHWLRRQNLKVVLNKLISGGLLVTDGSNGGSRRYRELCKYRGGESGEKAVALARSFTRSGCSF